MKALYEEFPFRSVKKFVPLALKHGFSKQQAIQFLDSLTHDKKYTRQEKMMLPIFSRRSGGYQMDTLVQSKGASPRYFLILININSRKLYAIPMNSKNSSSVLSALQFFINEVKEIHSITSDQDAAYLKQDVVKFMIDHKIDFQTTFTNDHNRLGIINRAIKTLRDINNERDFTIQSMKKALNAYNNSIHSSTGKEPNEMSSTDEDHYIQTKIHETDDKANKYNLSKGSHVRIMNPPEPMKKKRLNLTNEAYKVAYKMGNKYVVKALDNTASEIPRYRLIEDNKAKLAQTLGTNRAIINEILSFVKGKYRVRYDNNAIDTLPIRNLREGRPTRLSPLELQYWRRHAAKGRNQSKTGKNKAIPKEIQALIFLNHSLC